MKKQILSLCRSTAAGIVLPLLTLGTAHGSLVTWSSSVNGGTTGADWNSTSSWLGGGVPLVSDTVVINNTNSNYLITPLSNVSVGSGTMINSATHTTTLDINSGVTFASTSSTNAIFTVGAYSIVNLSGTMSYSAHAAAAYMVNGGTINVNNGGVLTSTNSSYTTIQGAYNSPGGVVVNQGGKYIDNGYQTRVGGGGGISSYLTINGGMASFNQLAIQCPTGNTATLTVNSGTLSVGTFSTTTATINISGGVATIGGLTNLGNSAGATATMTQTGGTWNQTGNNYVIGGATSTAIYNISGGTFNGNAYAIQVGSSSQTSGTAQLNISGGTVSAAKLDVQYGTASISGGTTTLTNFNVASTGSAAMAFTKGVLNISGTTTYGAPSAFQVGDGTNAATLNLTSGTHTFTNGLSVKSGATLANNANVIGNLNVDGLVNGSGTAGGAVTVNSGTVNGSGLTLGATTLNGASTLKGYNIASSVTVASGTTALTGTTKSTSTLIVSQGATLNANGTINGSATVSGLLSGTSKITGSLALTSGTLSPGNSPGLTTVSGDFTMDADSKLVAEISGTVAGTSYDQLKVSGNVSLNGTLDLTALSGLTLGETITLIDNTGSGTTTGYFTTILTSGSTYTLASNSNTTFTVGGAEYVLSYTANADGDGQYNDVTLTVVPEPGAWAMLLGGFGMLVGMQKLRQRNTVTR